MNAESALTDLSIIPSKLQIAARMANSLLEAPFLDEYTIDFLLHNIQADTSAEHLKFLDLARTLGSANN